MKVCFFHEDFDKDVSSGTRHAAYQWVELLLSFGIKEVAVVNTTSDSFPCVSAELKVKEYNTLEEFRETLTDEVVVCAEPEGEILYRNVNYKKIDWLVIGGADGTNEDDDKSIVIPTEGKRALYPREAAAILLAEASWQLH